MTIRFRRSLFDGVDAQMAEVRLDGVHKTYPGDVKAVVDVNLDIRNEEFVVLVGPSGCGKTTTLRMIAGLEDITAGRVYIGDRLVNDVAPKDRDIAMVFQNYALYPHMTVYKNLAFALKLRRFSRREIDERVRWAAGLLELEELLDRRPRQLSGGQRQRVAVGRAIVRHPKVFLFDEPLSNLDAKLRVTTRAELKRLQRRLNTTTIYVTHDQEEAMTLGDRVVVMNGGYVHQCGTPLEVYRFPRNCFVAGFVGMPPMNFIQGRIAANGNDIRFVADNFSALLVASRFRTLSKHAGCAAVLGFRPEAVGVAREAPDTGAPAPGLALRATVDVVEVLGPTMDIFVRSQSGHSLVCRVPTQGVSTGETVSLRVAEGDIHIFEHKRETAQGAPSNFGANLTVPDAPL
jgi:multiple sugar transport system ATP-binding protein